jgi:hypothetical protein
MKVEIHFAICICGKGTIANLTKFLLVLTIECMHSYRLARLIMWDLLINIRWKEIYLVATEIHFFVYKILCSFLKHSLSTDFITYRKETSFFSEITRSALFLN